MIFAPAMGDEDPPLSLGGRLLAGFPARIGTVTCEGRRSDRRRLDEGAGLGFGELEARLLSLAADQQAAKPCAFRNPEEADRLMIEDAELAVGLEMLLPVRRDVGGEHHRLTARDGAGDHRSVGGRRRHHLLQRAHAVGAAVADRTPPALGQAERAAVVGDEAPQLEGEQLAKIENVAERGSERRRRRALGPGKEVPADRLDVSKRCPDRQRHRTSSRVIKAPGVFPRVCASGRAIAFSIGRIALPKALVFRAESRTNRLSSLQDHAPVTARAPPSNRPDTKPAPQSPAGPYPVVPRKADQVRGRAARRVAGVLAACGQAVQVPQFASLAAALDFQHWPFCLTGRP